MGEAKKQHGLTLAGFYMARYPVTVAQFRAFLEDAEYQPRNADCLRGPSSHPVVNVTWRDALAYCGWLTDKLQHGFDIPASLANVLKQHNWQVSLPSESEWKKAARGADAREYPWGETIDSDHANYYETGIGITSAAGCFPAGASPYGCLDMAGNVWEWTRSLWGKDWMKPDFGYPYESNDVRENLNASDNVCHHLRGGSFYYARQLLRCACRAGNDPDLHDWNPGNIGFRVALLPSNSDL